MNNPIYAPADDGRMAFRSAMLRATSFGAVGLALGAFAFFSARAGGGPASWAGIVACLFLMLKRFLDAGNEILSAYAYRKAVAHMIAFAKTRQARLLGQPVDAQCAPGFAYHDPVNGKCCRCGAEIL